MATFTQLSSGNWRCQVRRRGRYAAETFRRKKDADSWALEIERRFDRGEELVATLEWVDGFNNRRLLETIGNIPPAEDEARYYAQSTERARVA